MALHEHYTTGRPCTCTFNLDEDRDPEHLGSVRTSGKLHDFLMNPKSRPDLQSYGGRALTGILEQQYHDARTDPLMPWIAKEVKKGRIALPASYMAHGGYKKTFLDHLHEQEGPEAAERELANSLARSDPLRVPYEHRGEIQYANFTPYMLANIADWYHATNHPLRRGRDIMQMTLPEANAAATEYHEALKAEAKDEAAKGGEVVHPYPDGWTLRRLHTPEELNSEGETMGHCVGGYDDAVRRGDTMIYSLRDPTHRPHATMEISPTRLEKSPDWLERGIRADGLPTSTANGLRAYHDFKKEYVERGRAGKIPEEILRWQAKYNEFERRYGRERPVPHGGEIVQIQGKGNEVPKPEYQERLKEWFQTFPEADRPNWDDSDPITHVRQITDPENAPDRAFGMEGGYGPHGDYGLADNRGIEWGRAIESLTDNEDSYSTRGEARYHPDEGTALYHEALKRRQVPEFARAVERFGDDQQGRFDEWRDLNYDHWPAMPDEDAFQNEDGSFNQEPFDEAMEEYNREEKLWIDEHPGMSATQHLYQQLNPHFGPHPETGVPGYQNPPEPGQPSVFSKTASERDPGRYLWVYSPRSNEVTLAHEWETHPAYEPTHEELAVHIGETGLWHGYAYPIGGGWRIVNYNHEPVGDRYIIGRVVESLHKQMTHGLATDKS